MRYYGSFAYRVITFCLKWPQRLASTPYIQNAEFVKLPRYKISRVGSSIWFTTANKPSAIDKFCFRHVVLHFIKIGLNKNSACF